MREDILEKLKDKVEEVQKEKNVSDVKATLLTFKSFLNRIDASETNEIFVYLYSCVYDSYSFPHKVEYGNAGARYRVYWNIEQAERQFVPIEDCAEFESKNIVIDTESYFPEDMYHQIQKEFFCKSVKCDQEAAKCMILRNYKRLGRG